MMKEQPFRLLAAAALFALMVLSCGPASRPLPPAPRAVDSAAVGTATDTPDAPALRESPAKRDTTPAGRDKPGKVDIPADVLRTYPSAARLDTVAEPFRHTVVRAGSGSALGYITDTDAAGTTARGFGGPVPLRIYFDAAGRPRRIYILDNVETPAYLEIVTNGGLLDRLLLFDPARPDSIAAVTLATTSSRAIIRGVTAAAGRVAAELARPER